MKFVKPFKTRLVAALRSGEYDKVSGALHRPGKGYCCLGVACKLVDPDGYSGAGGHFHYKGHKSNLGLPESVAEEVTTGLLPEPDMSEFPLSYEQSRAALYMFADFCVKENDCTSLSTLNDFGLNFNQIADFIEEYC